jgi:TatD DNase family protein
MIDVHCHLNFHSFASDYDEVIKESYENGVTKIINVGTKLDSSQKAVELAEKYEHLYAIVGVHPHHADKIELGNDWLEQLVLLAKHPKVLAIGEIGMDYYPYHSNGIVDPNLQKETFIQQIELAIAHKLPLQIHNRQAGNDILEILSHYTSSFLRPAGMFHCMSGNIPFLKKVLDLGFYVGFDGNITYDGIAKGETTALSDLVSYTPLDRILTETDSPYLTPVPHRNTRNIPSYAIIIGEHIAQIKGISFEKVNEQTMQNAYTLFPKLNA